MVPSAIPFLPPAILVGGLTLLSTIIATVVKLRQRAAQNAAARKPFLNYPWLAALSFPSLLILSGLSIAVDVNPPADATTATVFTIILLVVNVITLVCWGFTIVQSARLGRRDWVINMLSGIALGSPLYSILGPTERRTNAAPVAISATAHHEDAP